MRPFRSRVQTKLFILFACDSLLKKQEKRKKRKTKQKVLEPPINRSKKVFYCCSRQILSLSLSYEKFSSLVVLFCSRNIFSLRSIDEKSFSYRLRTSSPKT